MIPQPQQLPTVSRAYESFGVKIFGAWRPRHPRFVNAPSILRLPCVNYIYRLNIMAKTYGHKVQSINNLEG